MLINRSIEHADMIDKLIDLVEEAGMDDWELIERTDGTFEMYQLMPNDTIAIEIARSFDYISVSMRPEPCISELPQNWPVTLVALLPADIERLKEVREKVHVDLQRRLAERIANSLHFDTSRKG